MEERLFLDGIALHSADITPGHIECAALVVPHLADAGLTIGNGAAVTAGVAAHAVAIELLVEITLADVLVNDVAEGGHGEPRYLIVVRFTTNHGRSYGVEGGWLAKLLSQSLACCCAAST